MTLTFAKAEKAIVAGGQILVFSLGPQFAQNTAKGYFPAGKQTTARADGVNFKSQSTDVSGTKFGLAEQPSSRPLSWSEEERFSKLACKEALDALTDDEKFELETLDLRRSVNQLPLPTNVVVARERLLGKLDDLIAELKSLGNSSK